MACKDCQHFDPEVTEPFQPGWGICHKACGRFNDPYEAPTLAWAGYPENEDNYTTYTHLNVSPDFGCVQFTPKGAAPSTLNWNN
jgi:hypothetical protein